MSRAAQQLVRMLGELGRISDESGRLTRTFLSPAMRRATAQVSVWMRTSGLKVRRDPAGNVVGRLESAKRGARTLLLGSHLDTVRDAGKYDGALGVLLPIVALAELKRRGIALPYAVEVLGFSEEEGVRFASAYLGSKAYTGHLRPADLRLRDADGMTVQAALERFNGDRFHRPKPAHRAADLMGYLEVHIEQGPVLESKRLAVGVVSAIAGQTRGRITFRGRAGHAGTTPMHLRRDALAGAAEFVLCAETLARSTPPLVATVGTVSVAPGAPNVIAGEAVVSLDVRHPRDERRAAALELLVDAARRIARQRRLTASWQPTQDNVAVTCSPELTQALEQSVGAVQKRSVSLVSGAGHDAVVMSALTPVAMLFVRCREGLSHHPEEYASPADLAVALDVVIDLLLRLGRSAA